MRNLVWMLAGLALVSGCAHPSARQVTLVASGMAFVLDDDPESVNPPLTFQPGERIRLVLRNEAQGLRHDVVIPAWDVAVEPIAFGESAEVTFTVPAAGGRVDYYCRPHATMMRGLVDVAPIAARASAEP